MDILFLGTSSGAPTRQRNVSALALMEDTGRAWCLVDCGEATQHQLLRAPLALNDLEAIFITHVHGDHCYGLPGLLASAGMQGRSKLLHIVAPAGIEDWIRATLQLTQLFLPYELRFLATESLDSLAIANWRIDAFPLSHRVPSFAYRFTEAHVEPSLDVDKLVADGVPQGPVWGQLRRGVDVDYGGKTLRSSDYVRVTAAPRRIVVGGDNDRPELLAAACDGAQLLIHEATYTEEIAARIGDVGHSTAAGVASFARSIGLPNLLLTHFSARYQADPGRSPSIDEVRMEAERHYRGRLFLAEDFARFRLDRRGSLERIT